MCSYLVCTLAKVDTCGARARRLKSSQSDHFNSVNHFGSTTTTVSLHYLYKHSIQIRISNFQYTTPPPLTPRRFPGLALAPPSTYTPHHAALLGSPEATDCPVRGVYASERSCCCKGIYILLLGGCLWLFWYEVGSRAFG